MIEKFKFFSGVVITKGHTHSLLTDLMKSRYKRFDNSIYDQITECENKDIHTIDPDLLNYFVSDSWGHITDRAELFESIDLVYHTPNLIDNCILDYSDKSNYDLLGVLRQLVEIGCVAYQIRFYHKRPLEEINILYRLLTENGAEFIEFCLPYEKYDFSELQNYNARFYIYGCPPAVCNEEYDNVIISTTDLEPHLNCGFVNINSVNINHYLESLNHNTCLNRKVGVDMYGNIKNCPSSGTVYGNLTDDKLIDVINREDFQQVWTLSKDKVNTCKYCEFRNICTDCRVFTLNNELYEKPEKCNYDPFTGSWS